MAYSFSFSSVAKTVQVRLLRGADIEHLGELDPKLWLMLSCANSAMGPEGEPVAKALDSDGDGRVRVPEVLAAIDWLRPRLRSFDSLFAEADGITPEDLADTPEGELLACLLKRLAPEGTLTPAAMGEAFTAFRASAANGDGIVPPTVAGESLAPIGEAILAITGGAPAADGTPGIDSAALDGFAEAVKAYRAWVAAKPSEAMVGGLDPAVTTAAVGTLAPKIDAFFLNCELLRYNPAAAEAMPSPKTVAELADAPIALPSAEASSLPFAHGINPNDLATMATIAALAQALDPTAEALTPELWESVRAAVAPFKGWLDAKPAGADVLAALTPEVLALADAPTTRERFDQALAEDAAHAPLAEAFGDLQRVMTLRFGLLRFLRNFVNAEDLYPPKARALFQTGTLYMDGRACSLCFPIEQAAAAHATAAAGSNCCLVYCTLARPNEATKRTICAVFTAGSAATLAVGRNGVFFDLEGKDWEATLTVIKANPMGLWEAFFAPWRKIAAAFGETIRKVISGKHEAATASMVTKAQDTAKGATPAAPANGGAVMATVATLGIALSFVATAVTGILAALTNTPIWKTGLAIVGLILVVSIPSVILTWFRLRARDLAPILNASGWAVNRRIGLTPSLGRFFTRQASYLGRRFVAPPPMAQMPRWPKWVALGVLLAGLIAAGWWYCCPTSPRNRAAVTVCPPAEVAPEAAQEPAPAPLPPTPAPLPPTPEPPVEVK